jgi:hypothetical protein
VSRGRLKRIAIGLTMLSGFLFITFGTGLGLLLWSQSEPPAKITRKLTAAWPWFLLWRLLLFGALIGFWPAFCRGLVRWRKLTDIQLNRLLAARWHVAAWIVALELLLGQNVVGRVINLLVSRT